MLLPDVNLDRLDAPQYFRHHFHPLVLPLHHLRAQHPDLVRYDLIHRNEHDRERQPREEGEAHLQVEQVQGDPHLQGDAPEGVEAGAGVDDAVGVGGHEVHDFADGEGGVQGRAADAQGFPVDCRDHGGADFQADEGH